VRELDAVQKVLNDEQSEAAPVAKPAPRHGASVAVPVPQGIVQASPQAWRLQRLVGAASTSQIGVPLAQVPVMAMGQPRHGGASPTMAPRHPVAPMMIRR